jgi:hypothetical protein
MSEVDKNRLFPYSVSANLRDLKLICDRHPRKCQCAHCWILEEQQYVLKGVQMGVLPEGVLP